MRFLETLEIKDEPPQPEIASYLESFYESLSDPIIVIDTDLYIIGANESAQEALQKLGFPRDITLLDKRYPAVWQNLTGSYPKNLKEKIGNVCKGDKLHAELDFPPNGNNQREIKIILDSVELKEVTIISILHKIPEETYNNFLNQSIKNRSTSETNLDSYENTNHKNIIDNLPVGLFRVGSEGTITGTNTIFDDMLGYSGDELKRMSLSSILDNKSKELGRIFEVMHKEDNDLGLETELTTRQGESISVYLAGNILNTNESSDKQLICVAIDITDYDQTKEAFQENQRRLSVALKLARAGVWDWYLKTGKEFWDKNTERLFGLEPGEFEEDYISFLKRVHPEDRDELESAANSAIENNSTFEQEFRIQTNDDQDRWLLSRGEVLSDDKGQADRMLGVTMDISERKKTQQALEDALKEKETLLNEIHHRVKNNMQIINSFLAMQNRNIDSEQVNRAFTESISRVRAMAMIHEKLYQAPDITNVNLNEYLQDLSRSLIKTRRDSGDVQLKIDVEDFDLEFDEFISLGLIVNELITNSLQHGLSYEGNDIVSIEFRKKEANSYELIVSDNGRGFPENFDPESMSSTGFDIVRSLAEFEMNGTIDFENNEGATVSIKF